MRSASSWRPVVGPVFAGHVGISCSRRRWSAIVVVVSPASGRWRSGITRWPSVGVRAVPAASASTAITAPTTFSLSDAREFSFPLSFCFLPLDGVFSLLVLLSLCEVSLCSQWWRGVLLTFACASSAFFASSNSFGTPCGLSWALKHSFHSVSQNVAASLSRKPVSCICSSLMFGCTPSSQLRSTTPLGSFLHICSRQECSRQARSRHHRRSAGCGRSRR